MSLLTIDPVVWYDFEDPYKVTHWGISEGNAGRKNTHVLRMRTVCCPEGFEAVGVFMSLSRDSVDCLECRDGNDVWIRGVFR